MTHLRFSGLFNDQFIIQSLLSLLVNEFLKIGQYFAKLWARVGRPVFFLTHGYNSK